MSSFRQSHSHLRRRRHRHKCHCRHHHPVSSPGSLHIAGGRQPGCRAGSGVGTNAGRRAAVGGASRHHQAATAAADTCRCPLPSTRARYMVERASGGQTVPHHRLQLCPQQAPHRRRQRCDRRDEREIPHAQVCGALPPPPSPTSPLAATTDAAATNCCAALAAHTAVYRAPALAWCSSPVRSCSALTSADNPSAGVRPRSLTGAAAATMAATW